MPRDNKPELNEIIDQLDTNSTDYDGTLHYCKYCGQPIMYTKKDENGNPNRYMDYRWKNRVCSSCWNRHLEELYKNKGE